MYYITVNEKNIGFHVSNMKPEDMTNVYEISDGEYDPSSRYKVVKGELQKLTESEIEKERNEFRLNSLSIEMRNKRDALLSDSDKYMLLDNWESYSDEQKTSIKDYRKKLRDLPSQKEFPEIEMPTLIL